MTPRSAWQALLDWLATPASDWLAGLLGLRRPAPPAAARITFISRNGPMIKLNVSLPASTDPLVTTATVYAALDGKPAVAYDVTKGPAEVDATDTQTLAVYGVYTNKYGKVSTPGETDSYVVGSFIPAPAAPGKVGVTFVDDVMTPAALVIGS